MILARLIMRVLLVPLACGLAVLTAVLVVIAAHWNRFVALLATDPAGRDDIVVALMFAGPAIALVIAVSAMAMMLPAALGVLISEAFAIRSWVFHALNGALSAWVGSVTMVEVSQPYDFYGGPLIVVGAGIAAGRIRYREDIVDGLEKAPEAFIGMLEGRNFGKLIVGVDP